MTESGLSHDDRFTHPPTARRRSQGLPRRRRARLRIPRKSTRHKVCVGGDLMTECQGLFAVTVAVASEGSRSDLLAMASVLHRRGVKVVEAELTKPAHGRRIFNATFNATLAQAETVLKSFQNMIDVLDAALFEAVDARGIRDEPPASSGCRWLAA